MTHPRMIAIIPPVITMTIHLEMPMDIEMNIQDTLARGMLAFTTLLQPHPLQREIIDGP